jgi:2-polyprenyl-6-hydroxyphenyl methylase/3-demethylubiquinone-9 3-methyltransferase
MLDMPNLEGRSFLDSGCGSGLFSLAAMRLGARRVFSFDYDPDSVACAAELKRRYFAGSPQWTIQQGSVLDDEYLQRTGRFDIVYCWGVLHQTGDMWKALETIIRPVGEGGRLFISIYNHQPLWTPVWKGIKRTYNAVPRPLGLVMVWIYLVLKTPVVAMRGLPGGRNRAEGKRAGGRRGMSWYYDAVDWVGGYPHETASPEAVFRFYRDRGFRLTELTTVGGGSGCNQFVFQRVD